MPATATYRIGPSDFFSGGDLAADADTVQRQIETLDALLDDRGAPPEFSDQWTNFESDWRGFYADHFGGFFTNLFTALNDSNRDDLIRYEHQLVEFQRQAAALGAQQIAPVGPSAGAGDTIGAHLDAQGLPTASSITVLVVAIAILLVVWKVASK